MKKPIRFILLDDDLFTLAIEKKVIQNYCRRPEIITFSESKDAIAFMEAEAVKDGHRETIFVTDLHMPELDGFELLDRLENIFNLWKDRLHIFVLSAAARIEEIKKVLAYSCVIGFYHKPLSTDKLAHLITSVEYPL